MTSRGDFIARVRSALGTSSNDGSAAAESPAVDDNLVRLSASTGDVSSLFATRAAGAGMSVHRCAVGDLASTALELVEMLNVRTAVLDHMDAVLARPVADALARSGVHVIDPRAVRGLEAQFDADAGITGVIAAIAETGTLVVTSDVMRSRGSFMIPPVHFAVVHESQIVADMLDVWSVIGARPPTAITFVTGPSKTADIEGVLVTGVHGPREVHVVLVS